LGGQNKKKYFAECQTLALDKGCLYRVPGLGRSAKAFFIFFKNHLFAECLSWWHSAKFIFEKNKK
jgi:hypothetical protein